MTAIPAGHKGPNVRARFYKDDNGQVWCEENVAASKDSVSRKATPEMLQRWAAEYDAYEKGLDEVDVGGTPLVEVPGINKQIAQQYKIKGIRNAEDLAAISDGACSQLGIGALSARKAAQNLIAARRVEAMEAQLAAHQSRGKQKEAAA